MSGDESYDFEFLQQDVADNFQEFPSDFMNYELFQSLSTKTKAMNIRAGLKYNFSPFRFGFSVALPYNISVEENHGTQERLIFDNSDFDSPKIGPESNRGSYYVRPSEVFHLSQILSPGAGGPSKGIT